MHDHTALGLACSYVVQREGAIAAYASENAGFTLVEFDGGDGLGRGGESQVGDGGRLRLVPNLNDIGSSRKEGVRTMVI